MLISLVFLLKDFAKVWKQYYLHRNAPMNFRNESLLLSFRGEGCSYLHKNMKPEMILLYIVIRCSCLSTVLQAHTFLITELTLHFMSEADPQFPHLLNALMNQMKKHSLDTRDWLKGPRLRFIVITSCQRLGRWQMMTDWGFGKRLKLEGSNKKIWWLSLKMCLRMYIGKICS